MFDFGVIILKSGNYRSAIENESYYLLLQNHNGAGYYLEECSKIKHCKFLNVDTFILGFMLDISTNDFAS